MAQDSPILSAGKIQNNFIKSRWRAWKDPCPNNPGCKDILETPEQGSMERHPLYSKTFQDGAVLRQYPNHPKTGRLQVLFQQNNCDADQRYHQGFQNVVFKIR